MKFDGRGVKKPGSKSDNKHIGKLRPQTPSNQGGGPIVKSGRQTPLGK
jgi:hypothetical protein